MATKVLPPQANTQRNAQKALFQTKRLAEALRYADSSIKEPPVWVGVANAGVASMLAAPVTNPLDRAKTLLQMPNRRFGSTMTSALSSMVRTEGPSGLFRGLPAAMLRESSKNCVRIGLFKPILSVMHPESSNSKNNSSDPDSGDGSSSKPPLWKRFAAGACTGAIGAICSNPFELIKTRMQAPMGSFPYKGLGDSVAQIIRSEGTGVFYKGVGASVARDMLGSSANMAIQSLVSDWLVEHKVMKEGTVGLGVVSGLASAAASVLVMQPVDTSRAYVYLNPGKYKNAFSAFTDILFRGGGPLGLYRGALAHFMRVAPHYALMFGLMEKLTSMEAVLARKWHDHTRSDAMRSAFQSFDLNSSNRIDISEVEALLKTALPLSAVRNSSRLRRYDSQDPHEQPQYQDRIHSLALELFEKSKQANAKHLPLHGHAQLNEEGLDLKGFTQLIENMASIVRDVRIEAVFNQFDLDHDGRISKSDVLAGLEELFSFVPEGLTTQVMEAADVHNKGYLSLSEIRNLCIDVDSLEVTRMTVLRHWASKAGFRLIPTMIQF
mmetsp:Transcript_8832/g.32557  ORF Transcript_8832/g.32557 Transcript_8832/m.32557 type:complete len:551 (-) Transcript_8832:532-2184(-)